MSSILLFTTVNWLSTARLAGAFAAVGARVEGLLPLGHVARKSRFVRRRYAYDPFLPLPSLRRALARGLPDLIVPCDDRALALLRKLHAAAPDSAMAARIAVSLGRMESYRVLAARSDFIAAARASGIAAPETIALTGAADLDAGLKQLGFPVVLKADGSWGGDGIAIVRNAAEAHRAFRRLSIAPSRARSVARAVLRHDAHFLRDAVLPPHVTVSLQRFVPGTPATSAFACWQGRVLASIHMDVLESLGPTGPASVMRRVDCPQMEEAVQRIAARFGLSGLHGLDFIRDDGGRLHLIEINARATQSSALALGPGHDLAAALAGCLSPSVRGARPLATTNPVIALFPQEWRRDHSSDWLRTAYQDVPWDDPAVLRACTKPSHAAPRRRPGLTLAEDPCSVLPTQSAEPFRPH
jgi:hypothetical protein